MSLFLCYFFDFINFNSAFNALSNDAIINSMTNENGSAAMIMVFCKAVSPLTDNRMKAIVDWMVPQVSLTLFGGVNEPFVDCMPRTNVAESADVMKNEAIKKIAKTDMKSDIGITLNISKIVNSVEGIVKSTSPFSEYRLRLYQMPKTRTSRVM